MEQASNTARGTSDEDGLAEVHTDGRRSLAGSPLRSGVARCRSPEVRSDPGVPRALGPFRTAHHQARGAKSAPRERWLFENRIGKHKSDAAVTFASRPRRQHRFLILVMPEDRQQNDDRQRNAEQPQQQASSEAHGSILRRFVHGERPARRKVPQLTSEACKAARRRARRASARACRGIRASPSASDADRRRRGCSSFRRR